MTSWKITGIIATLIIILTPILYLGKVTYLPLPHEAAGPKNDVTYVGHQKCIECHKKEYQGWDQSHHDHAMAEATEATVRGDFNNTVFRPSPRWHPATAVTTNPCSAWAIN